MQKFLTLLFFGKLLLAGSVMAETINLEPSKLIALSNQREQIILIIKKLNESNALLDALQTQLNVNQESVRALEIKSNQLLIEENKNVSTPIVITGIVVSPIIALVGLSLNYLAFRRSNRIAVSTKLVEASKLLSDELIALVRDWQAYEVELKETKARPDTSDDKVQKKIASLKLLINNSLERQNKIDEETVEIQSMFSQLNKVDPGNIDAKIAVSYRMQAKALGTNAHISNLQKPNI